MPPKVSIPTRAPTARKRVASSKLRDENNIDDAAVNARNTTNSRRTISPSVEEVEDEEAGHTFEHPKNPERLLERSDGSDKGDDDNDVPVRVTTTGKRNNASGHSGQKKAQQVSSETEEQEVKSTDDVPVRVATTGKRKNTSDHSGQKKARRVSTSETEEEEVESAEEELSKIVHPMYCEQ